MTFNRERAGSAGVTPTHFQTKRLERIRISEETSSKSVKNASKNIREEEDSNKRKSQN